MPPVQDSVFSGWAIAFTQPREGTYALGTVQRRRRMTKLELAEKLLADKTYDLALPQPWVDDVADLLKRRGSIWEYRDITYGFVWLYDKEAGMCGRPFPLTYQARRILMMVENPQPLVIQRTFFCPRCGQKLP
jgi:hypothetical protein